MLDVCPKCRISYQLDGVAVFDIQNQFRRAPSPHVGALAGHVFAVVRAFVQGRGNCSSAHLRHGQKSSLSAAHMNRTEWNRFWGCTMRHLMRPKCSRITRFPSSGVSVVELREDDGVTDRVAGVLVHERVQRREVVVVGL